MQDVRQAAWYQTALAAACGMLVVGILWFLFTDGQAWGALFLVVPALLLASFVLCGITLFRKTPFLPKLLTSGSGITLFRKAPLAPRLLASGNCALCIIWSIVQVYFLFSLGVLA